MTMLMVSGRFERRRTRVLGSSLEGASKKRKKKGQRACGTRGAQPIPAQLNYGCSARNEQYQPNKIMIPVIGPVVERSNGTPTHQG
jgi:hypothetical protein